MPLLALSTHEFQMMTSSGKMHFSLCSICEAKKQNKAKTIPAETRVLNHREAHQ